MANEMKNPAAAFRALSDPTRINILETLACCAQSISVDDEGEVRVDSGPTAGDVCCRITGADKITSTISHHLRELRGAGLIRMERRGKCMLCAIDPEGFKSLTEYLRPFAEGVKDECC
ncbi:MAG: metalloregulator ArsR/SmtB family transcription factor [Fimbriimonadaceae bacterium]